jgi:hypothetical protein
VFIVSVSVGVAVLLEPWQVHWTQSPPENGLRKLDK